MAFVIAAAAIVVLAVLVAIVTGVFGWGRSAVGPGSALLAGLVVAELLFGTGLLVTRSTSDTAEEVADIPFEPAPLPVFTPGPSPEVTATPAPRRRRTTPVASPVATPTVPPPTATPPVITEPDPEETPEEDDICPADNPDDPDCEDFTPEPPPPTASP